ncbi:MAG: 40S ribosomal protein S19 [Candidatus Poseidoniaceae archaeon]|nr:40S ribosomal protein S19 [Candidatus Poseidoniaceae archaeon]
MTTFYDVPANFLIPALAEQLKSYDAIKMPEWADVVKTGSSRERPPSQTDWWHTRGAALLRKVARQGPIGVTALSQEYGGRKNNGSKPNTPGVGSRKVIRILVQQDEDAGLVSTQVVRVVEPE